MKEIPDLKISMMYSKILQLIKKLIQQMKFCQLPYVQMVSMQLL